MTIVIATQTEVLTLGVDRGTMRHARGMHDERPTCVAADPWTRGRAWCGTNRGGVFRSDDAGESWQPVGLHGERITAVLADPVEKDVVWVGMEPSAVWRSVDGGISWQPTRALGELPSSSEWSFPPKPDTHHVRWIAAHPQQSGRLWVAVEAGALVSTRDGGRGWHDRVAGGPWDTHELAIHPESPDALRVAAGDGYFESADGGASWSSPMDGLDVGYLRSVAIDPGRPDTVLVSASSRPRSAYVAGSADGRLYRRVGDGRWDRVRKGWPEPPDTIAPLLLAGRTGGEVWAADERGVHRSSDGGSSWHRVAGFETTPHHLRGIALVG